MARGERLLLHLKDQKRVVTIKTTYNGIPCNDAGSELLNGGEVQLDPYLVDPTDTGEFIGPGQYDVTAILQYRSALLVMHGYSAGYNRLSFMWYNGRASPYAIENNEFHKEHAVRMLGGVGDLGAYGSRSSMCFWPSLDGEGDRVLVIRGAGKSTMVNSGDDNSGAIIDIDPDDPSSYTTSARPIIGDPPRFGWYGHNGGFDYIGIYSVGPPVAGTFHSAYFDCSFTDLDGNLLCEPFRITNHFVGTSQEAEFGAGERLRLVPPEMDSPDRVFVTGGLAYNTEYQVVRLTWHGQWYASWANGALLTIKRESGSYVPQAKYGIGDVFQLVSNNDTTTVRKLGPGEGLGGTSNNFTACDIGPDGFLWVLDYGPTALTASMQNFPAGYGVGGQWPGDYDPSLPTPIWRCSMPIKVHAVRRSDLRIVKSLTLSAGGGTCWAMNPDTHGMGLNAFRLFLQDDYRAFFAGSLRFDANGRMWVSIVKRNNRNGVFPGEGVPYSQPDADYLPEVGPNPFNAVVPIIGIVNLATGNLDRWWVGPAVRDTALTQVSGMTWFNKRGRRGNFGVNGAIEPVKRRPVGFGGEDEVELDSSTSPSDEANKTAFADCACKGAVELKYPAPTQPRRPLAAKFLSAAKDTHLSAYFVLMVDWRIGGTKCYSDRRPSDFDHPGRHLPIGCQTNVHSWGEIGTQLTEGQVGTFDRTEVTIHDQDGSLRRLLASGVQQTSAARIWLAFDTPGHSWLDAVEVFSGRLMGNNRWSEASAAVTLEFETHVIQRQIGKRASRSVFPLVHPEHEDKALPVAWGCARRVEAVCVRKPWETRILTSTVQFTGTGLPKQVVLDLLDHPEDIGAPIDKLVSAYIGPHEVQGTFRQSTDTGNTPSTFECNVLSGGLIVAKANILYMRPTRYGAHRAVPVLALNSLRPANIDLRLMTTYGQTVKVFTGGAYQSFTLNSIEYNYPHDNCCAIYLNGDTSGLSSGDMVVFPDPEADRVDWLEGMPIRERGGNWKYLCNMLPSAGVARVEGYGTARNEMGVTGKDFISLGRIPDLPLDQYEVQLPEFNLDAQCWTQNVSDSEWAAKLGHNVTTISFDQAPHSLFPQLDSDRLWVTLTGTVGGNGKPITNPAYVLYGYLTSGHFLAFSLQQIDGDSFADAANCLADFKVGFAQVEVEQSMPYLQEIARQCHCALQWTADGKLRLAVLRNDPTTAGMFLSPANIQARSLSFGETRHEDLVSTVVADWRRNWDDITGKNLEHVILVNAKVEALVPKRVQRFPIWIYSCRQHVEAELTHWLNRWSRIMRTASVRTTLDAICLRPGDSAALQFTDGEGNEVIPLGQSAIVRGTKVAADGVTLDLEWIAHDRR